MKKIGGFLSFVGSVLIIFGVYLLWQRNNPQRLAFAKRDLPQTIQISPQKSFPMEIKIDSVGIDLPIIGAEIKDGIWQTTSQGVSYLISSPVPGEEGNSILYGHNWKNLLAKLIYVKPGDDIHIVYESGENRDFKVEFTQEVTPDQTGVLDATSDSRLTLYTCSGLFDSKRFVVVALAN
jgi:LPXTG-site transpeptidase (sortase) family protein